MSLTPLVERRAGSVRVRTDETKRSGELLVLGLIIAVGGSLRLTALGQEALWLDEAMSNVFASQSLLEIWSWMRPIDPYYPPGYYTALFGWTALFGHSEESLRGLSVLAGVATLPFVFYIGKLVRDARTGLIAATLIALAGYQVEYAQEARAYALLCLSATVALCSLTWLLRYPRLAAARSRGNPARWPWVLYVLGVVSSLLLHNTGPLVWASLGIAGVVAWWTTERGQSTRWLWRFMQANVVVMFLYLITWLPVVIRQSLSAGDAGVVGVPLGAATVVTALRDLGLVQVGRGPVVDALAIVLVLTGVVLVRTRHRAALALVPMVAIVGSLLVSYTISPIFVANGLIWTAVPLAVLAAATLATLSRTSVMMAMAVAALVIASGYTTIIYFQTVDKEPWDEVAATIAAGLEPGDVIVHSADYVRHPVNYYLFDHLSSGPVPTASIDYEPAIEDVRFAIPDAERVWLVYAHNTYADPEGFTPMVLEERGELLAERIWPEHDIKLYLYESTLAGDGYLVGEEGVGTEAS